MMGIQTHTIGRDAAAVSAAVAKSMAEAASASSVLNYLRDTGLLSNARPPSRGSWSRSGTAPTQCHPSRCAPLCRSSHGPARLHMMALWSCGSHRCWPAMMRLQMSELTRAVAQAQLPPTMGGMGLTAAMGQRVPCYTASALASLATASVAFDPNGGCCARQRRLRCAAVNRCAARRTR